MKQIADLSTSSHYQQPDPRAVTVKQNIVFKSELKLKLGEEKVK